MHANQSILNKEANLADYIIQMYRKEDLIHSYSANLDDIFKYVIVHMSKDQKDQKKILLEYADLIEQMTIEKITDNSTRLESTQSLVHELTELHQQLIVEDSEYELVFNKSINDIDYHITLSNEKISNPIQVCLNGIYGMLLLKLDGIAISGEQKSTLSNFGAILTYLSNVYKSKHSKSL